MPYDVSAAHRRLSKSKSVSLCGHLTEIKTAIDGEPDAAAFNMLLRKEFIAAHLVLNERVGCDADPAPAPAFRPRPIRSQTPKGNAAELSNITRLIDMHYCWSMGHRPSNTSKIAAAFDDQFDFEKAYEFVRSNGSIAAKLKLIGLDDTKGPGYCRIGNVSLVTEKERMAIRSFTKNRNRFEIDLRNKQLKASVNVEQWVDILASASLLEKLDMEANGRNLKLILCLAGRVTDESPYRLKEKYQSACNKLGL